MGDCNISAAGAVPQSFQSFPPCLWMISQGSLWSMKMLALGCEKCLFSVMLISKRMIQSALTLCKPLHICVLSDYWMYSMCRYNCMICVYKYIYIIIYIYALYISSPTQLWKKTFSLSNAQFLTAAGFSISIAEVAIPVNSLAHLDVLSLDVAHVLQDLQSTAVELDRTGISIQGIKWPHSTGSECFRLAQRVDVYFSSDSLRSRTCRCLVKKRYKHRPTVTMMRTLLCFWWKDQLKRCSECMWEGDAMASGIAIASPGSAGAFESVANMFLKIDNWRRTSNLILMAGWFPLSRTNVGNDMENDAMTRSLMKNQHNFW